MPVCSNTWCYLCLSISSSAGGGNVSIPHASRRSRQRGGALFVGLLASPGGARRRRGEFHARVGSPIFFFFFFFCTYNETLGLY